MFIGTKHLLLSYSFKEGKISTFVRGVMYILLKYRAAATNQQIHVSVTRISCGWHLLCVKRIRIHIPQRKNKILHDMSIKVILRLY